jgi:hypothetical protein
MCEKSELSELSPGSGLSLRSAIRSPRKYARLRGCRGKVCALAIVGASPRRIRPTYSGFPVEVGGVGELHAAFLNESRTRGTGWGCVQEIRVSHDVFCREMWEGLLLPPRNPLGSVSIGGSPAKVHVIPTSPDKKRREIPRFPVRIADRYPCRFKRATNGRPPHLAKNERDTRISCTRPHPARRVRLSLRKTA